jgi:hypothetical protein
LHPEFAIHRYIGGEGAGSDGGDLIREAGGGIVAVTIEYRLGVFGKCMRVYTLSCVLKLCTGFLAGSTVKRRGALNAGLRMHPCIFSDIGDMVTMITSPQLTSVPPLNGYSSM